MTEMHESEIVNPRERTQPLKKTFVTIAAVTFGLTVALVVCAAVALWYWSRPKPLKPWNTSAVTARFDSIDSGSENKSIRFAYILENHTVEDYKVEEFEKPRLVAQLAQEDSLGIADETLKPELPIFLPPSHKQRFVITLAYPYPKAEEAQETAEQRRTHRANVAKYVREELSNLNGFVFFDETHRYEIKLPRGW